MAHQAVFVCCCVLTPGAHFLVIFDLMNPSVGFFRGDSAPSKTNRPPTACPAGGLFCSMAHSPFTLIAPSILLPHPVQHRVCQQVQEQGCAPPVGKSAGQTRRASAPTGGMGPEQYGRRCSSRPHRAPQPPKKAKQAQHPLPGAAPRRKTGCRPSLNAPHGKHLPGGPGALSKKQVGDQHGHRAHQKPRLSPQADAGENGQRGHWLTLGRPKEGPPPRNPQPHRRASSTSSRAPGRRCSNQKKLGSRPSIRSSRLIQ